MIVETEDFWTEDVRPERSPEVTSEPEPAPPVLEEQTMTPGTGMADPLPDLAYAPDATSIPVSLLVGTSTELEHGTGGLGDHPAPAVMVDSDGSLHVAGEAPAGNVAGSSTPVGDTSELQSGDLSPEAKARYDVVAEPVQVATDRPDIGTPTE